MPTYHVNVSFEIRGSEGVDRAVIDALISALPDSVVLAGSGSVSVDEIPEPPDAKIIQFPTGR